MLLALVSVSVFAARQDVRFWGMCYSPFRDGQSPETSTYPSRRDIARDLRLLRRQTSRLRTYSVQETQIDIARRWRGRHRRLYVGAWISSDASANQAELERLATVYRYRPTGLIIGSEVLFRNDLTPTQLISLIQQVKTTTRLPVGVADTWSELLDHEAVIAEVDFVMCHIHPYWEGIEVNAAPGYVLQRWRQVANAYPDKQVMIGETGWPTAGTTVGSAVPSLANQEIFLRGFLPMAMADNVPYFLFEVFDEAWKTTNGGTVEGSWGVFTSGREMKASLANVVADPPPMIFFRRTARTGAGTASFGGVLVGQAMGIAGDPRDYRVVCYTLTDKWYVQPTVEAPYTRLRGRRWIWRSRTHLGDLYAALVVPIGYDPPIETNTLPTIGDHVLARAIAPARNAPEQAW